MAIRRTTMYSTGGKKLYAVRAADGTFKDIQTYERAHRADMAHKSAAEKKTAVKKAAKKKSPAKKAAKKVARKATKKVARKRTTKKTARRK
jgi:DNA-binding protein HU-beta